MCKTERIMQRLDQIRLILADLDGTLLNDDKVMDTDIKQVLQERNLDITFVTGRNRHIVSDFIEELHVVQPFIINNGAHIMQGSQCLYQRCIEQNELEQALQVLINHETAFLAYSDDSIYCCGQSRSLERFVTRLIGKCAIHHEKLPQQDPIFKVTVVSDDKEKMGTVMDIVNTMCPSAHLVPSEGNVYTLTHRDATKGNAVRRLLDLLKIDASQVLAFGDNYNDISMFEVIPNSVAMSNAEPLVLSKAAFVAGSNNANGVSSFIRDYIQPLKTKR